MFHCPEFTLTKSYTALFHTVTYLTLYGIHRDSIAIGKNDGRAQSLVRTIEIHVKKLFLMAQPIFYNLEYVFTISLYLITANKRSFYFFQESGLSVDPSQKEPFVELNRILEALKVRVLRPALE